MSGAGSLRSAVMFETRTETVNASGGRITGWKRALSTFGELTAISAREGTENGAVISVTSYRLRLRWRPDINTTMRVMIAGTPYAIRAIIDPDGRRRYLQVSLEQGAGN